MIKQLINDLVYDKIALTQGLTRAKLIAYKIKNDEFKEWIIFELEGYSNTKKLPPYRIISCQIYREIYNSFIGSSFVVMDSVEFEKNENSFYKAFLMDNIPTLEEIYKTRNNNEGICQIKLPQNIVNELKKMAKTSGGELVSVEQRFFANQIGSIINVIKQKLIDTLLELNDAFPNIENDYKESIDNIAKVQNIITQNIYGNNANSNIGVGDHFSQEIETNEKLETLIKELRELGIEDNDTNEIRNIIVNDNKENKGKIIMSWVGKMTTKAVEKGIELQVPLLIDKLNHFI